MFKKFSNIQFFALALILLISSLLFIYYYFVGRNNPFSNDSDPWGQFGDYLGGVLNPIISLGNMYLLYRIFRYETANAEKVLADEKARHQEILRNSVIPWGDFHFNLNNCIEILFTNHGNGPLIVDDIKITWKNEELGSFTNLQEIVPYTGACKYSLKSFQFPKGDSTTLSKDGKLELLRITSPNLNNIEMKSYFDSLLSVLAEIEISIKYRGIYQTPIEKKCSLKQWQSLGGYFVNGIKSI